MHRGLVLCLVALLMVSAGVASAETYLGLRFGGYGNYIHASGPMWDAGLFTYREFAVGFGDKIQGEVSLGWNTVNQTWDDPDEVDLRGNEEDSASALVFGVAGFYPIMDGSSYRVDAGARLQFLNYTNTWTWDPTDQEDTTKFSGWSFGPLVRGAWELGDLPVTFGPEACLKYTSLTYTYERAQNGDIFYDEEVDASGFSIDYSFRLDFHFD